MSFKRVEIGPAVLYCGDAIEVLESLPAASIDALCVDAPYSSGGLVRGDRMQSTRDKYQGTNVEEKDTLPVFTGDNRDQRSFVMWCTLWLIQAQRVCKPGAIATLFTDWRQLPATTDALQAGGWVWRGIVPWDKVNARPMPDRFRNQCEYVVWGTNGPREFKLTTDAVYHPGVLNGPAVEAMESVTMLRGMPPTKAGGRIHSTQKPVEVMKDLVMVAPAGGTVLDLFMGSATTGVAAIERGRKFIGIEKDPHIFDLACQRLGGLSTLPLLEEVAA